MMMRTIVPLDLVKDLAGESRKVPSGLLRPRNRQPEGEEEAEVIGRPEKGTKCSESRASTTSFCGSKSASRGKVGRSFGEFIFFSLPSFFFQTASHLSLDEGSPLPVRGSPPCSYDFGAAPLPYSSSSTAYKLVHPPVAANSDLGTYAPSRLPPCRHCRGASTFELQLMPHLALGLDERYEWASVWVLSCEAECPGGGTTRAAEGEAWREERVLVEWEDEGA